MSDHIVLLLDDLTPLPSTPTASPLQSTSQPRPIRIDSPISLRGTLTRDNKRSSSSSQTTVAESQHPPPEARTRWYFGRGESAGDAIEEDTYPDQRAFVTLTPERGIWPAVITSAAKSTKFTIPNCATRNSMCSIVLGISTKDLDLNAVEAIVITFTCDTGGDEHSYSEVITHKEFKRMARNEMQDTERLQGLWDDMLGGQEQVWRCKLYKKLFMSKSALDVRIEIRTWDTGVGYDDGYDENEVNNRGGGSSMLSDYGSLALYFVEILTGAQEYNAQDSSYQEHKPFISFADVNMTGCQDLDSASAEYPQVVTHYSSSMDGSHVVVATVAGSGDGEFEDEESDESDGDDNDWEGKQWFLQVWSFKGSIAGAEINKDSSSQEKGLFQPQLVAWMQLGSIKRWNSELSLSYDGTQLAILDAVPFGLSLSKSHADEKRVQKSIAAFYRCNISTTEAPEGAVAGSGLKRNHVEENHASLRKFCGWGQFHIVVSSNPDPKDELFVAYDGITIEVFSVYYETWSHVRSILLDHPKEELQLSTHDVHPALSGQLCGRLLVIKEPGRDQVLTMWDIELGVRASSFSGQAEEQSLAIGRTSVMSKDGKLVAIPGCRYVDLFWTESWTLAGTCSFPRMNLSAERIESIQFIRDGTEIIVMFKSQGYIVNTDTMRVTEQVISEGPDRILALNDSGRGARTLMFCVEDSRITLFNLDDRIVCSPSKVRERCCDSLCTIESPSKIKHDNTGGKKEEVVSPSSGLRFRAEKRTVTVIRAGHREGMSFVVATACDSDGSIVHRMSTPLPGAMVFRSAVFMGGAEGCSFLVVALDKLIMIWSTPTKSSSSSLQGKDSFVLRLVQNVDSNTQWKICPHNQLYGHKTPDPTMKQTDDQVIHNRHLYDPTTHAISFLKGVQELVEMFEFSSMALRRDILQYIGNHVNQSIWHSDRCYNVVSFLCENWSPRRHAAVLLFLRSLLYEDMAVRWVPRASAAHEEKEGDGNPILYLVAAARIDSKALEVAEVLVEYLVRRARVEKDPIYLTLIMQSLPKLVVHPGKDKKNNPNKEVLPLGTDEFVTHIYRHMAHLPTRPSRLPLGATKEEQEREWSGVHATLAPRKDTISKELYFASFDMLWYTINSSRTTTNGVGSGRMRVLSRMGVLWNVFVHKFKLSLKDTVRCYPFVEKEHGNPAIEALIDYKWNVLGFAYWRDQFITRCCYYLLVLLSVMLQIWGKSKVGVEGFIVYAWAGMFFDISATSFVFLCVEVVQMFRQGLAYFRSIFNILDFLVLALPLTGSINQLCALLGVLSPPGQNPGLLSFSVLVILLHFVAELRVYKGVARVVSSFIRGIESIAAFLGVYVLGVLGFLVAFMHMIPACDDAASCRNPASVDGVAVSDYFAAVSGNHLSGRNGWSEARFYSDNWANFLLAFAFFLFNFVMFVNMTIVLIQDATKEGVKELWKQDWCKHRLKFIESAENMSYWGSGTRTNEKFPDVVYYSATTKEIQNYEKETQRLRREMTPLDSLADSQRKREVANIREIVERHESR